jgi:hypothetical protein
VLQPTTPPHDPKGVLILINFKMMLTALKKKKDVTFVYKYSLNLTERGGKLLSTDDNIVIHLALGAPTTD